MQHVPDFDAIIVAGGSGRRLGGVDKALLEVDGITLLERVRAAVVAARRLIVVGPIRETDSIGGARLIWCREDPPGGGPVAGLAAGLLETTADVVVTLAVDLPWIAPAVPALRAALGAAGGSVAVAALVDETGHPNYLAAAWRRDALSSALRGVGEVGGAAMRTVFNSVTWLPVTDRGGWSRDIDNPGDLPD